MKCDGSGYVTTYNPSNDSYESHLCPKCKGEGCPEETKTFLFKGLLLVILSLISIATCNAQHYYTFNNEGPYTLNEEWVGLDVNGVCDTVEGYWTDSIFNAGRIQYIFTDKGVTKLTKLFHQGTIYKSCSITDDLLDTTEEASVKYPYWSITKEHLNGKSYDYLLGWDDFDCEPIIRVYVTNVVYNTNNKTIRGEQNGKAFYLWNIVNNELSVR